MQLTILRKYDLEGATGRLLVDGKEFCKTLERPNFNNQSDNPNTPKNDSSCIPEGVYRIVKRFSEHLGNHLHILDVPKRELILIHSGNCIDDILGCALVGDKIDGPMLYKNRLYKFWLYNSKKVLAELLNRIGDQECILKITSEESECKI